MNLVENTGAIMIGWGPGDDGSANYSIISGLRKSSTAFTVLLSHGPFIQAVYEEDLIHRQPGIASTLNKQEEGFPVSKKWIQEEKGSGPTSNSFTRIVIGELKTEILKELGSTTGREQLCRSSPTIAMIASAPAATYGGQHSHDKPLT